MKSLEHAVNAIQRGDADGFRTLLADKPQLADARDEKGMSLIMLACYHRQPAIASLLAEMRPIDVFEAAALGANDRLVQLCLEQPELVHASSPDGFHPLHLAAFFGRHEALRFLIERGADVNAIADNPSRVWPLHSAVASRNGNVVRLLVEHGADLNVQQHGGWTPLHSVAMHGDGSLVELFLERGADPGIFSDDGKDAAALAESAGFGEIAAFLRGSTSPQG
jgi:ankyrin repeat protein